MKKRISTLLILALILGVILAFTACNQTDDPCWADALYTEDTTLGEGKTELYLTVKAGEKSVKLTVRTDKAILGDALSELGVIEGEPGAYGLYVKKVNGILADYDADKHYWALWIGSDYAPSGVDSTEIEAGAHYTFERAK